MLRIFAQAQPDSTWDGLGTFFIYMFIAVFAIILVINIALLFIRNHKTDKKLTVFQIVKVSFVGLLFAAGLWALYEVFKFDRQNFDYALGVFLLIVYILIMKLTVSVQLDKKFKSKN